MLDVDAKLKFNNRLDSKQVKHLTKQKHKHILSNNILDISHHMPLKPSSNDEWCYVKSHKTSNVSPDVIILVASDHKSQAVKTIA